MISREPLTEKQREILAFMRAWFEENDALPTHYRLSEHFGWKSQNAASCHLATLERKGYLQRNADRKFMFARPAAQATQASPLPSLRTNP